MAVDEITSNVTWTEFLGRLTSSEREQLEARARMASGDETDFTSHVRSLAESRQLSAPEIDSVIRQSTEWRNAITNTVTPQEFSDSSPQTKSASNSTHKGFHEHASGSEEFHNPLGEIGEHLRSIQEEKLQQAFRHLLDSTDSRNLMDEVDKFFDNNFDAQRLLSDQYSMLRGQINALDFSRDKTGGKKQIIHNLLNQEEQQDLQRVRDPYRGFTRESDRKRVDTKKAEEAERQRKLRLRIKKATSDKERRELLEELFREKMRATHRQVGFVSAPLIPEQIRKQKNYHDTYSPEQLYHMSYQLEQILYSLERSYSPQRGLLIPQEEPQSVSAPQSSSSSPARPPTQQRTSRRGPSPLTQARQTVKNAAKKFIKKFAKEAIKKAAMALASQPEFWIVVAIVVAFIVLIIGIVVIIIMLSNQKPVSSQSTPQPPTSIAATCNPNECVGKLKALGINVAGNLAAPLLPGDPVEPLGKVEILYDALALAMKPPSHFGTLLQLPQKPITINFISAQSCGGHASSNGTLKFYGWCSTPVIDQFMILHELGHMIAFRNPALYWSKFVPLYFGQSLFNKNMPTYNCMYDYGVGPYAAECWADMVGEYVFYRTYRDTVSRKPAGPFAFPSFPSFANGFYYNFAKDNIYNGVTF